MQTVCGNEGCSNGIIVITLLTRNVIFLAYTIVIPLGIWLLYRLAVYIVKKSTEEIVESMRRIESLIEEKEQAAIN
jgi:hypothetical protein